MTGQSASVTQPATLTVLSGNLLAGGIGRSRTEDRFAALMGRAAQQQPDIFAAQECLYFDERDHALLHEAERLLGMHGVLGISPHTRMHTAIFVRAPLRIAEHRVYQDGIWHHSVTHAVVTWDGSDAAPGGRLRVASVHLAPRNPARRLLEAGELTDYASSPEPALLLGDTNTEDEHTDLSEAPPAMAARFARLGTTQPDTAPIDLLRGAGMVDLAPPGPDGAPTRTTGHWPGRPIHGRVDRALANPAAAAAARDYTVITTARAFTDHDWLQVQLDRAALANTLNHEGR